MNTLSPSQRGETFTVPKLNPHDLITNIIVEQLEKGIIPWQKPWTGGDDKALAFPKNCTTGKFYRGINIVLLLCSAIKNEFASAEWASMKQWNKKGESIRKGEKGNLIVYYDTLEKEVEGEIEKIAFLKTSYVFNRCQLKGYQPPEKPTPPDAPTLIQRMEQVDTFIANTKAIIEYHDGGACYIPSQDKIKIPFAENFIDTTTCTAQEGFYSTQLHELAHWSGAEKRLNRTKGKKFGDQQYAGEELIAEFTAAFLCAGFGMRTVEKGDHAGYIQSWLKLLNENRYALVNAASEASKAVDYLHSLQPVNDN